MAGRKPGNSRRVAPVLEALEDRQLLNARMIGKDGKPINQQDYNRYQVQKQNNVPLSDRRISYTTPDGAKVQLTLFGFGTLKGTTIRPDGALDIVYNNTTNTSKIVGHVTGGNGYAPLASLRDADVVYGSPSATGSNPISVVNLKKFDLVADGFVNIRAGVGTLALHSTGPDSRIYIAVLPTSATAAATDTSVSTTIQQTNTGGIASSTGQSSVVVASITSRPAPPPGAEVSIPFINGTQRTTALGNAQIFGFDSVGGNLIRFDAITGDALQGIPVPDGADPIAGVGLGRNNGRQVALVGTGTTIYAYDVVTGAPAGQFTVTNLAAEGLTRIDGIGSSDTRTFVSDSSDGPNGVLQGIDVTASLASGQAVIKGAPYFPTREFQLSGGVTGLAGSNVIYSTGAAHFDTFVPNRFQLGILGISPNTISATEVSRAPVPGIGSAYIDAALSPASNTNPVAPLGSIAGNLAVDNGVINGKNLITLFAPAASTLTSVGTVSLNNPNPLSGLSESFHPELAGGALIDNLGAMRRLVTTKATGLVLNSSGAINLVQINQATDSAVIGRPLNHVDIAKRNNVTLVSSARGQNGTSTKNGVVVKSTALPIGVLTIP